MRRKQKIVIEGLFAYKPWTPQQKAAREEFFARKGWTLVAPEKIAAFGLDTVDPIFTGEKFGNSFRQTPSGQIGYAKFIPPSFAFSEHLTAGLFSALNLPCGRPELEPSGIKGLGKEFACFSPILGARVQTIGNFIDNAMDTAAPAVIERISCDLSSLVPAYLTLKSRDVNLFGLIIAESEKDRSVSLYSIDHEKKSYGETAAELKLSSIFHRLHPFFIDMASMAASTEKILALPDNAIREQVQKSFDACQISLTKHPTVRSAPRVTAHILQTRQSLEADLQSEAHMGHVFRLQQWESYADFKKRAAPSRPELARQTSNPNPAL